MMRLGRYETLRPIASGGMAVVHLARALGAGGFERLVALKVMHPHISSEPDFVAMFLDEARLAAHIRHPNVVATIDVQHDPLFLVMEYVEGPSLGALLRELRKRKQPMDPALAVRVLSDVLAGLHAAHEQLGSDGVPLEIVHRDVSPQNVLIGIDGISRITDFGVARAASRLSSTRGGQVKGKLAYMAPEQVAGKDVDRRVDVYAAGAVLYEALTGLPLFRADNDAALMAQIVRGVRAAPCEMEPRVPTALSAVCMRALSRKVDARYATAAELADALEAAAHEAGLAVPSARGVSTAIKSFALHEPAPSSPGSMSGRLVPPPPPSGSGRSGPYAVPAPTPSAPGSAAAPSGDAPGQQSSSTSVGTLLALAPAPPPAVSRWRYTAAAVGLVGLVAGTVVLTRLLSSGGSERGTPAAAGEAATVVPAGAQASAQTASAVAASSATPAPTAAASEIASAAPSPSGSTAPDAPGGRGVGPRGTPKTPPPSRTNFRPDDL